MADRAREQACQFGAEILLAREGVLGELPAGKRVGYLADGTKVVTRDGRPPAGWPLNRSPHYLETNVPGLFAAGDVRHGSVKRFASAVGEAMTVTFVHRYLADG